MTALSLTYALVNGNLADAAQVQQDLDDIVNYVNTDVIRTDGASAMSGMLTLSSTNPSNADHAVRKGYMDGPLVIASDNVSQTFVANTNTTIKFNTLEKDTASAYVLSTGIFTAPIAGVYQVSFTVQFPVTDSLLARMQIAAGAKTYLGPRFVPSQICNAEAAIQTFSLAVFANAGDTILPQVSLSGGVTRSLGTNLSIAWLHG